MSIKAEEKINKEEAVKLFTKNCINFNKMFTDEKCEGIKINFINSLEKLSNTLNLDSESTIKLIFENILKEKTDILKSKNLMYSFINLCKKKNEKIFQKYFFNLLLHYYNSVSFKKNYSNNYLIDIALDEFFESESDINEELVGIRKKLFSFFIENDIKTFECIINKYIFVRKIDKDILLTENNIFLVLDLFTKFIVMNKYKSAANLFLYFNNEKDIKDIVICIIKTLNETGYKLIEKSISISNIFIVDDSAIFHSILLNYLIENKLDIDNDMFDTYLIKLTNFLVNYKSFNIDIIENLYKFFKSKRYKNFNEIFPISLYYLSQFTYTNEHIKFLINTVFNGKSMSAIYEWIIYKNLSYFNKITSIQQDFNPKPMTLTIINDETKYQKVNLTLSNKITSLSKLSTLTLLDYIIKDTISIISLENTDELFILFNEVKFHHIIKILNRLNLNEINNQLLEILSLFIIDFIASILDISINSNQPITNGELIENCLKIIKQTNTVYQESVLYIGIIQIMRNTLFLSYDSLFIKEKNKNEIIDIFYEYLLEFSRNEQVSNLVFKLLIALYKEKSIKNIQRKKYAIDKLVKLCINANNGKVFEAFFKFFKEFLKKEQSEDGKNAQYAIYTYAKFYEGSLFDSILNLSLEKFKEDFEDKRLNLFFDNKTFFSISLISQIYQKDKPFNLQEKIDYYNDKFSDILKSLIEKTKNLPSLLSVINGNDCLQKYNSFKNFISCLDFDEYILLSDNNDINKEILCAVGVIKFFSSLISEYINNSLNTILIQDSDESEKRILENKINLVFNYVLELILSEDKNSYNLIIINEILYKYHNLNYFMNDHTNLIANKRIKDNEEDFSKLNEYTFNINYEKNNGIFSYIKDNPFNLLLINNLVNTLSQFEVSILLRNEETENNNQIKKHLIINTIWKNSLFNQNLNQVSACFFISILLNNIFSMNELEKNQPIFCYLCDNCFFTNTFFEFPELLNFDYILIEYYSLIRIRNNDFKTNVLTFLLKFLINMDVNIFSLRLFSNYKTFRIIIRDCSEEELKTLFDIINNLLDNLISYNSYQIETQEICENIISNIQNYLLDNLKENPLLIKKDLVYYGELLLKISKDKLQIQDDTKKKNEVNPKLKNFFINKLSTEYIPNFINTIYTCIKYIYNNETRKEYLNDIYEYQLNNLYSAFNIIILFKFNSIIPELSKNLSDEKLKNFIDEYSIFNLNECSINSMNTLLQKYLKCIYKEGDLLNKLFNEYLFVYLLFNNYSSIKEETLHNSITFFLDERNENNEWKDIYDKKKFGFFIIFFILIKLKNKELINFNPSFLFKDFEIIYHIGERLQNEINKK